MRKKTIVKIVMLTVLTLVLETFLPSTVFALQDRTYNFSKPTLTGVGATDMVQIAQDQNNRTQNQMGYTEAWCADFVSDCARIAGQSRAIPPNGSAGQMYDEVIRSGGYVVNTAKGGDLVFYKNTSLNRWMHVGIMIDANTAISGNYWRNDVSRVTTHGYNQYRDRYGTQCTPVFVRPNYSSTTLTKPTVNASTSGSNVTLSWSACSGATYYWLDVYVDGAASGFLSKSIGNVTSYTITDLSPGNYTAFLTAANSTTGITSDGIHFRIGVDAVDVGTDFYAYIINTPSWKHLTNDGDNVSVRTSGMILDKQVWKFERQSDLSYIIRSCVDTNKVLGVDGSNGNVLAKVSNTDWGKWYISGVSADYRFTNKQTFQVLDLAGGETADGTNVQQWESNGTNAQKFQIWKIPKPAATTLKVTAGTSEKETIFSWISEVNTRNYNLRIYKGTAGNSTETMSQWNMTGTSCSVKLPAGYYEAYIDTVNQAGFTMSNVVKFTVQASSYTVSYNANGGTGAPGNQTKVYDQPMKIDGTKPTRPGYTFLGWSTSSTATSATYQPNGTYTANSGATLYAVWKVAFVDLGTRDYPAVPGKAKGCLFVRISCAGTNLYLTNKNTDPDREGYPNVALQASNGTDNQIWEMVRLANGCYKIVNRFDQRVLDICNNKREDKANVGVYPWLDNTAQKWYIYQEDGKYVLRPVDSMDYCLAVERTEEGSNVQLSDNNTSQKYFNIEILEQPGKSTLKVEQAGSRSVPTKISWTPADKATWYNLYFYDGECWKSNCIKSVLRINGTTCEVQLEPGTYQMHLSPQNYYPWTNSEPVEFTVAEDTYTISYRANGGSGAPDAQIKEYNVTLTLSNTKPTRSGYTFLGWSTSSTAISATYQPSGSYTDNSNVTLYAVWKQNSSAISGNVTSYDIDKNDVATVRLLNSAGTSEVGKVQCEADTSSQVAYEIKDVQAGNYILKVSKEGHVTRTYEITVGQNGVTQDVKICLIGDVTGDGKVNTRDLNRVYAHVNGTNPLTGYEFDCGDVTGDGKINTRDLNRLYAHISETNLLW